MDEVVLDASAILALLNDEPGAEVVAEALPRARVGAANLAEVVGKLADAGLTADEVRQVLVKLALRVVPLDQDLAVQAGLLRAPTRGVGLSLGDRTCLALAARLGAVALTTDRAWADIDLGIDVEVRLIR